MQLVFFKTLVEVSWASRPGFSIGRSGIMFPVRQFSGPALFKFLICVLVKVVNVVVRIHHYGQTQPLLCLH